MASGLTGRGGGGGGANSRDFIINLCRAFSRVLKTEKSKSSVIPRPRTSRSETTNEYGVFSPMTSKRSLFRKYAGGLGGLVVSALDMQAGYCEFESRSRSEIVEKVPLFCQTKQLMFST